MDLQLNGRRALVTGGSRGIGRAIAEALAAEGAVVALAGRSEKDLCAVVEAMGDGGHVLRVVDLVREDEPKRLLDSLIEFGELDIVVHALGGSLGIRDPLCGLDAWSRLWRINLEVAVELNELVIPGMRERRWGRIVHLSSVSGGENLGPAPYCTVKAALNAYTRSFGRIFAADGVVISAIAPGAVMSPGGPWDIARKEDASGVEEYAERNLPTGEFGRPEDVAVAAALLCSEKAHQFCGCVVPVDGGLGRGFS